jgi:thymidylate synthase (FAD)
MSARYTQMPNLHYLPSKDRIKKQSTTNKQGSGETVDAATASHLQETWAWEQGVVYNHYDKNVEYGIAKELARLNTPVSRYSRFRAKTDLRNWLGFLKLRMAPGAQWEIRQYANAIAKIVKAKWPRTYALFEEYDLNAVNLSATEVKVVQFLLDNEGYPAHMLTEDEHIALCKKLGVK